MTESLDFTIDKLELIETANKSQFAKARVDFFASGQNSHNMPVSEANLRKYAETILGKPLTYVVEKGWFTPEDFGDHADCQKPMGFFSELYSNIEFTELPDGRVMASTIAFIWKKYAAKAMSIFSRDGGKKAVSVEMQIFSTEEHPDGSEEIIDFAFTGCTILGKEFNPAIADANIEIIEFSKAKKEYEEQLKKYSLIDFSVPKTIQDNVRLFLDKAKEKDINLLPTALTKANYIIKNNTISPEKVQGLHKFFSKHKEDISFSLCGGEESKIWIASIVKQIEEADQVNFSNTEIKEEKMVDFSEDQEDKKEEDFGTDSNVEASKPVEMLEGEAFEEKKEEEMSEDSAEKEEEEEEKEESPEEEKKEEMSEEMSCLKAEMCDLQAKFSMLETENKELREFKASIVEEQRKTAIEFSLSEVMGVMPKDKIEEWRDKSKDFSSIEVWANAVKAEAFTYVKQNSKPETFSRMALPNVENKTNVKKSLWAD